MNIYSLNENNSKYFASLLPPEMQIALYNSAFLGLVAVEEQENQRLALGALVFELVETYDAEQTAAFIRWLYVPEGHRNKGVGSTLLESAVRLLNEVSVYDWLCDLTLGEEHDNICSFLEDFGFEFHFSELYEVVIPIQRIRRLAAKLPPHSKHDFVKPLSSVTQADFVDFVQEMKNHPEVLIDLPEEIDAYDDVASCVSLTEDGAIRGMLLVGESPDGMATVFLLRMRGGDVNDLGGLLTYSMKQASRIYPKGASVRVNCWHDAATNIVHSLFPDLELALVRRGHFNALEGEDEN